MQHTGLPLSPQTSGSSAHNVGLSVPDNNRYVRLIGCYNFNQ